MSPPVTIYMKPLCPYCRRAELLLAERGFTNLRKLRVDLDPKVLDQMIERTGARTVPQIFIGDLHIGGCDQLFALDASQGLKPLFDAGSD